MMRWTCSLFAVLTLLTPISADDKPKPAKDPELQKELLKRVKADQEGRKGVIEWMQTHGENGLVNPSKLSAEKNAEFKKLTGELEATDKTNTQWLGEVVERVGWPTNTLVGSDGAKAAWLLVQHADRDAKFQRKCLDLMTKLPKDEVSQKDLAYLTDRVLLAEGKKQKYGTQFANEGGKWVPRPLEDEAGVDRLRAEVGLPTMAEYIKQLEAVYGPKKK